MEAAEVIMEPSTDAGLRSGRGNAVAIQVEKAQAPAEASVFSAIERIMTDPNASVERANQAFEFYQKVQADQARKAFDAAMADAKAEMPAIVKNRVVDFTSQKGRTNYKHEDLGEIARTIDPILGKHGLSYRFRTTSAPNEPILVTCIVSHRLGYSEENSLQAGRDESGNKNSIQAIGSTITYLQRYTLKAALGLAASNDDDGKGVNQSVETVTDEQVNELRDLITKTKTDLNKFLEVAKAECVPDILAKDFPRLKQLLTTKLKGAKS